MKVSTFFKKLFPTPDNFQNVIRIYYQCHKCQNSFELILRKSYDIQSNYEDNQDYAYLYVKELRDPKCFNTIRIRIYFDQRYNILNHEITGGKLISKEEYETCKSTLHNQSK